MHNCAAQLRRFQVDMLSPTIKSFLHMLDGIWVLLIHVIFGIHLWIHSFSIYTAIPGEAHCWVRLDAFGGESIDQYVATHRGGCARSSQLAMEPMHMRILRLSLCYLSSGTSFAHAARHSHAHPFQVASPRSPSEAALAIHRDCDAAAIHERHPWAELPERSYQGNDRNTARHHKLRAETNKENPI